MARDISGVKLTDDVREFDRKTLALLLDLDAATEGEIEIAEEVFDVRVAHASK